MREVRGDDGAVAVLVALLALVMFGFGALVIDVGMLYGERRQLQNGADAAALALAQSCSTSPCTDLFTQAQPYADGNAEDDASNILDICGAGAASLTACSPAVAAPGTGHVRVSTRTGTSLGETEMPVLLSRFLDRDDIGGDDTGVVVGAHAVANWGSPGGLTSAFPITFGNCEWEYYTNSGSTYPGTIDPDNWPPNEAIIFLMQDAPLCPGSPPGGDSSGGFGWLGDDAEKCGEKTVVDDWVGNKTGVGSSGCDYTHLVGTTVYIPVYDCHTDTTLLDPDHDPGPPVTCHGEGAVPDKGTSVRYHIVGYAAFYLTGFNLPGNKAKSLVTGDYPCKGKDKCVSGFFSQGLVPTGGPVTDGPSYGASVVGLFE